MHERAVEVDKLDERLASIIRATSTVPDALPLVTVFGPGKVSATFDCRAFLQAGAYGKKRLHEFMRRCAGHESTKAVALCLHAVMAATDPGDEQAIRLAAEHRLSEVLGARDAIVVSWWSRDVEELYWAYTDDVHSWWTTPSSFENLGRFSNPFKNRRNRCIPE